MNYFVFCSVDRQWRDLAFCLSLLSFSERSLRKLQENFACFNDKLYEDDVYNSFCSIMNASKKFAKSETRVRYGVFYYIMFVFGVCIIFCQVIFVIL